MAQGFSKEFVLRGGVTDEGAAATSLITNLTAAARAGTTLTAPVATNTKPTSFTECISSTGAASYGLWVRTHGVAVGASARDCLVDIATGAAGAETVILSNIDAGESGGYGVATNGGGGKTFYFPGVVIPASTRISARNQGNTTSQVVGVNLALETRIKWTVQNSNYVTYGDDTTNSRGTSVTPGNGAFGNWTQIGGATSRTHSLWVIGLDALGDTTVNNEAFVAEVGYGPDAGSITTIASMLGTEGNTNEAMSGFIPPYFFFPVASGQLMWVRLAAGSTEARGVILYGN